MAKFSVKIVSVFIVFMLVLGVGKIEAGDDECLKEFGGNVGFMLCAPRIFPSLCYLRCRSEKGALGGKCVWGDDDVICYCDYCSDDPRTSIKMRTDSA